MIIAALKSNTDSDTSSPIHLDTIKTLIDLGAEVWFEEDVWGQSLCTCGAYHGAEHGG